MDVIKGDNEKMDIFKRQKENKNNERGLKEDGHN